MHIKDKILEHKDAIQSMVNEIDCNDHKWFLYDVFTNKNPVVKGWSTKMSYKVMNRNVGKIICVEAKDAQEMLRSRKMRRVDIE